MHGLAEFLNARYDEEEAAASKAAELCGCHAPHPSWSFGDETTDGRIIIVDDPHPDVKRKLGRRWNGSYEGLFTAQHIVRHDPAHVLADINAKRQLLAIHTSFQVQGDPWPGCNTCSWRDDMDDLQVEYPCATLRLLALPYADQPGYDEDWRP